MYFLEYYVTKLLLGYLSKQCKLGKLKIKKKGIHQVKKYNHEYYRSSNKVRKQAWKRQAPTSHLPWNHK